MSETTQNTASLRTRLRVFPRAAARALSIG